MKEIEKVEYNRKKANSEVKEWFFPETKNKSKDQGFKELRPEQEKTIKKIVKCYNRRCAGKRGSDVFLLMKTGGGKSLCFQYPALFFDGITIVVEPLVRLMYDQEKEFNRRMKASGQIYRAMVFRTDDETSLSKKKELVLNGKSNGENKIIYKLVYITPESLRKYSTKYFFKNIPISMVVVDECHCISQWGYDFRESYMEIPKFINVIRQKNGLPVIAAFSATATKFSYYDVCKNLRLQLRQSYVVPELKKENLSLNIKRIKNNNKAVIEYVLQMKKLKKKGIVFCSQINKEEIGAFAKEIKKEIENKIGIEGVKKAVFICHSDLKGEEQKENIRGFSKSKSSILVATSVVSMGVDMKDIDYVVHRDIPESLEEYYQEVGRAGRDGRRAEAMMFFSVKDFNIRENIIKKEAEEAELRGDEFGEKKTVVRLHRFKKMRQLLEDTKLRDDSDGIYDAIKNYFEDDNYYNDNSKMDFRKEFRGEMKKIEQDIASINVNMTQVALLLRKGQYKTGIEKTFDIKKKIRNADNSFQTQVTDSVTFCVTNGKDKDNIDYFDMIVADAVYTVGEFSGKEKITISDIIRCMTGDPKTRYYRREGSGEMDLSVRVKKSVDKLNAAKITIMHKDLRGGKKVKFSGMALECGLSEVKYGEKKIKDKRNGVYTDVTMYNDVIIYKKSPLYEYAEYCNGEFMTIPHKMLNVMISKSDADGGEKLIKMPDSIVNIKIKFFLAYQTMLRKMSRTEGISLSYKNPELRLFGSDIESQKRKYLNDVFGNGKKEELFDKNGAENSKYRTSVSETIDKVLSYYERYFITKNADGPLMVYIKVYRYRKSKKGAWKKYICRENEGRFKYSEIFFDEVIGGIEKTNEERRKQIKKTNKKNCFPIYEVCGIVENLAKYDPEFIGYLIIFH